MTVEERERDEQLKKKQALANSRFYFLVTMLVLIAIFTVGTLFIWITMPKYGPDGQPVVSDGPFTVRQITLEGNTHYREEVVLHATGLTKGQSIFNVNGNQISQALMQMFPYYTSVDVKTLNMSEVKITVTETAVIGVVHQNGTWISVGANGKAVEMTPVTTARPKGLLYFKGTIAPEGGIVIGGMAMDDYSFSIINTLLSAMAQYGLTDIIEIDVGNLSDIRMNWRGQIDIRMGNPSNLTYEVGAIADVLPKLIAARGEKVSGVLNLTSYSNEALDDQVVFTPSSLLPTTTTSPRLPSEEDQAA